MGTWSRNVPVPCMKTKSIWDIESRSVPPTLFFAILSQKLIFFTIRVLFLCHFVTIYTSFLYITKILFDFFLERKLIRVILDNIINNTMQLITNKYQTQLISSLIINNLHYNFIILNNKLIFTHTINKNDLTKLLNKHYYKYKLVWHYDT